MLQLFTQTDKKLIPTLPRYAFEGRIIVVQSESEAQRAVNYLRRFNLVGLDTETRPSFRRGTGYKISLLQISTPEICFLFRLNFMGLPQVVVDFLQDASILKVGLSLKDDIGQLRQRCADFQPQGFVDLQDLAAEMGIRDMSLAKLYANFFRQRISKNAQLSNWEADVLDEKQKVYAATDADACVRLFDKMKDLQSTGDFELLPPSPEPERPQVASKIDKKSKDTKQTKRPRAKKVTKEATPVKKRTTTSRKRTTSSPARKTKSKSQSPAQ